MWLLSRPDAEGPEESNMASTPDGTAPSTSGRAWVGRIDPGARAIVIAAVMLVLVLCSVLPWVGSATGWQILAGQADPSLDIGLLPRLFSINSTIAGVFLSAVALTTRRWAFAFVAAAGCGIVSFEGLVAIWSRQTVPQAGPSFGLVLAVISMFVLAIQWLRIAWSRP
jgi:hypothetical protein